MLLPVEIRPLYTLLCALVALTGSAQIDLNKAVVLDGGHHVSGLAVPVSGDQALTAASLQAAGYLYCTASGTNQLSAALLPAPDALVAGLSIHILTSNTNSGAATLDLNGFGPKDIVKDGTLPLDSADVIQNSIVHLVYDGSAFQLINGAFRQRKACPNGFAEVSTQYCIEVDERPAMDFPDAAEVCGNLGGTICSWAEFYYACTKDTVLGLNDMVGDYEWTNSLANADSYLRVAGWNNCRSAGTSLSVAGTPRTFRCCYRR